MPTKIAKQTLSYANHIYTPLSALISKQTLNSKLDLDVPKQNKDGWISWNLLKRRWLDRWSNTPALSTILNRIEIYSAGYSDEATLAESIVNNTWTWPSEWSLSCILFMFQFQMLVLKISLFGQLMMAKKVHLLVVTCGRILECLITLYSGESIRRD